MFLKRLFGREPEKAIPAEWKLVFLDDVARRGSGHTPSRGQSEYWNGGIKWVSLGDSNRLDNTYIYFTSQEISELGLANSSAVLHPPETVILLRGSSVGKSAILGSEMSVSQDYMTWQCGPLVDNHFLYQLLQMLKPEFQRLAIGSTVKSLTVEYFEKFEIPLPPLDEQRKIAEILSTWDEAIGLTEQLIEALSRRKQALMQLLLTGEVRFAEFAQSADLQESDFGKIPADWCVTRLGELFEMSSGSTPSRATPEYFDGDILWVTSGELNYDFITDTFEKITEEAVKNTSLKLYPPDTFLMAITGLEAAGTRGRCGILGKSATVNQSCMAFSHSNEVTTLYLFYFYLLYGETIAFNYAQGTKQQSLPQKILSLVPICYPSEITEQQNIVSLLEVCEKEINLISKELIALKEQKRGLMQQLLTGQVRVQVEG